MNKFCSPERFFFLSLQILRQVCVIKSHKGRPFRPLNSCRMDKTSQSSYKGKSSFPQ